MPSSHTQPNHNLNELHTLFKQVTTDPTKLTQLTQVWIAQAELAINHNDRMTLQILVRMLKHVDFDVPEILQCYLLYTQGVLHELREDHAQSEEAYTKGLQKALALSSSEPDTLLIQALLKLRLGTTLIALSKIEQAESYLVEALDIIRNQNYKKAESLAFETLGYIYYFRGELAKANEYYEQGLELARANGDRVEEAKVMDRIGLSYYVQGRLNECVPVLEEVVAIRTALGQTSDLGTTYLNLGLCYTELDQPEKAINTYQVVITLFKQLNNQRKTGLAYLNLAQIYRKNLQPAKGLEAAEQASAIFQQFGKEEELLCAAALLEIAHNESLLGQVEQARQRLREVHLLASQFEKQINTHYQAEFCALLSEISLNLAISASDYQQAWDYQQQSLASYLQLNHTKQAESLREQQALIVLAKRPLAEPASQEIALQILLSWWRNAPNPTTLEAKKAQLTQAFSFVKWLGQNNQPALSLEVYSRILGPSTFNKNEIDKANLQKLDLGYHYLQAAKLAPATSAVKWLEEALLLVKSGVIQSSYKKAIEENLKAAKKASQDTSAKAAILPNTYNSNYP
jgi:tetratricopeptide (TPR) repeat protein